MNHGWLCAIVFLIGVLAACQSDSGQATSTGDAGAATSESIETVRQVERSLSTGTSGLSVSSIYLPPDSVQDLVNRVDAIAVGTISKISDTIQEGPYNLNPEPAGDRPAPSIQVTYYEIALEDVLLDDNNVSSHSLLRLDGIHTASKPQVGERYMFALGVNPDNKSYGVSAAWGMVIFDDGPVRNFDGTPLGYDGVTDQATLKELVKSSLADRVKLPPSKWPSRFR